MNKIKKATSYEENWLEIERPQPLSDLKIENLISDVLSGKTDRDISDNVYTNFKKETISWLMSSKLNNLIGLDSFDRVDVINGCTQFIDNLYMQGLVQTVVGDYRYHNRLGLSLTVEPGNLQQGIPLIIAMPFPRIGAPHDEMDKILNEAHSKNVDVHIDGAWVTCSKDLKFNLTHPAIKSIGISLSKGLGLGWNRVGLRWTKNFKPDAVSIMNDFKMNIKASIIIGLHFVRNLPTDYLWNTYGNIYEKICKDFNLTQTKSIHLALKNNNPVGLSPLIRYVADQ